MELFKITCVTCRARLSVRDSALIGQILACPRCGMMVQIAAPAGHQPSLHAAAAAVPVAAMATPPALEHALSDTEIAAPDAAPAPAATTAFDDAAEAVSAGKPAAPTATPPPGEVAAATGSPQPVASAWSTYKFAALIAASAVTGSALVAAALTWSRDNDEAIASAPRAAQPAPATPATASTPKPADPAPTPPEPSPPESNDDGLVASTTSLPAEEMQPSAELEIDEPKSAEDPPLTELPPAAEPTETDAADAAPQEMPADPPAPRLRIDPLDVDPEGLDLTTLYTGPPQDPLAASQLPSHDPPPPSVPREPRPDADAARLAAAQPVRRDTHRGLSPPPPIAPILARRLPALQFNEMPLCRVLDLAVQLTGLPVSVAPEQLRMAGVSAATPISVDAKNATIEEALATALKPLRLQPVVAGDQLLLQRIGEDKQRTVAYAVDDLAATDAEVQRLAAQIDHLLFPKGDPIKIEGRTLRIDALESTHYEVLILLERRRLARVLPTRSKYPKAILSAEAHHAAIADRLSAPATFTFAGYAPLREIFRYWQEELDVAVLVDWPALAGERLWPHTRIACSAADKPWADAMDSVLAPLGLGWRAVDRRTIEITTLDRLRVLQDVDLYRIDPQAEVGAGEQILMHVKQLEADNSSGLPDTEAHATPGAIYDATNHVLIANQSPAVHRQLANWLRAQQLLAK